MCSRRLRVAALLFAAFALPFAAPLLAAKPTTSSGPPAADLPYSVEVNHRGQKAPFTVYHPADWSPSPRKFGNVTELVGPEEAEVNGKKPRRAKVLVGSEGAKSHAAAVERLRQLATQFRDAEIEYTEIGGWPALYTTREAALQRPGEGSRKALAKYGTYLVTSVAIAVDDSVIRLRAEIPSKNRATIATIRNMAKGLALPNKGDFAQTEKHLEGLRAQPRNPPTPMPPPSASRLDAVDASGPQTSAPGPRQMRFLEVAEAEAAEFGAAEAAEEAAAGEAGLVRDVETNSEMETIASTSGKYIVVATHRTYSTSVDGGLTWTPNIINTPNDGGADTVGYNANGDSSLGFGQSGDFIYGFIAYPDGNSTGGAAMGDVVDACTTGIVGSTDNGLTFSHRGHGSYCARVDADGSCFPDQEHIAVDRWNPSGSGEDQIYNTWRNFTFDDDDDCNELGSGSVEPLITCSVDGGVTFNNGGPAPIVSTGGPQGTDPVIVGFGDGDFPRITAGPDGFVYVVYMVGDDIEIDKFTSCASGLDYVWPAAPELVVSGVDAVPCPVPGLDRCNDGNDLRSPTVAVDEQDASHVFVAFADNNAAGREDVYVADSTDGGDTWSAPVALNSGFATRRFMPWVASVCGEAFVGFYDRRRSTVTDNSLTDFFVGRAHRDPVNGLLKGLERRVSPTADSQCGPANDPDLWCTPRGANDSEGCSVQPQLAGLCMDQDDGSSLNTRCDFSDCGGANSDINFGANPSCTCPDTGSGQVQCTTGGGCPKYGDYNGITASAGRVYEVYASATPPGGPQDPGGDIDSFIQITNICAPVITVPGDIDFTGGCDGGTVEGTLNVCNTGKVDLEVESITTDNTQFAVTAPSSGYPVVISPDFCFPFEVVFTTNGSPGNQVGVVTIVSNDPMNPSLGVEVLAGADSGVPNIVTTIQPAGDFGEVCIGDFHDLDLTIHNSGGCPLSVTNVTSDDPEFEVGSVTVFPLAVGPGDTVLVPVRFEPTDGFGPETATFTVFSNDPDEPEHDVPAEASVGAPDINVPATTATVEFGNTCADELSEKEIPVCNVGECNLNVTGVTLTGVEEAAPFTLGPPPPVCDDFTIVQNPFPSIVSKDFCMSIIVRYTPTEEGEHTCILTILSDDPDEPEVTVTLHGSTSDNDAFIDVPESIVFNPEVVSSVDVCETRKPLVINNNGECPIVIEDVFVAPDDSKAAFSSEDPEAYALEGLPSFPLPLQSGHTLGDGDLRVIFAPDPPLDRDKLATIVVEYHGDQVTEESSFEDVLVCGEATLTGARVLVQNNGGPVQIVERIQLQRVVGNRNRRPQLDTVSVWQNVALQEVTEVGSPCLPFRYHVEFGTVSNNVQLVPGYYQVTATIRDQGGHRRTKTVAFSVDACDFNPSVIINFPHN